MQDCKGMRGALPQTVDDAWLPKRSFASRMHLPVGPVSQDFLGVTEAAAGVGRDLPRASFLLRDLLGLRATSSLRVDLAIEVSELALGLWRSIREGKRCRRRAGLPHARS